MNATPTNQAQPGRRGTMYLIIDTETGEEIELYASSDDAEAGIRRIERRYQAEGLHRFVVRDTTGSGEQWHESE